MSWLGSTPTSEAERLIVQHQTDLTVQQARLDDAIACEMRSEAMADAARAEQQRARVAIDDDLDEINALRELLPKQRKGDE